jgi:hypothetical protein
MNNMAGAFAVGCRADAGRADWASHCGSFY